MPLEPAHVALWWWRDKVWTAFRVQYSQNFVNRLKNEIPYESRAWLKERQIWLIDPVRGQDVRDLVSLCTTGGVCKVCWKGAPCPAWHRIHWEAIGTDTGGLAAKRRQNGGEPVDLLVEARLLVGVGRGATRPEIRLAARKQALRHHPDRGGNARVMAAILAARDQLLEELSTQKGR